MSLDKLFLAGLVSLAWLPPAHAESEVAMPGSCRGRVANQFNVAPIYVKASPARKAPDGTTTVSGTVDLGTRGVQTFACVFDRFGRLSTVK